MKKRTLTVFFLLNGPIFFAQRARDWGRHYDGPELPLPSINWEYTGSGLLLFAIGLIWTKLTASNGGNQDKKDDYSGCIPVMIMGAGVILIFPLIFWIFAILKGLIGIGIAIFISIIIGIGVFSLFKK